MTNMSEQIKDYLKDTLQLKELPEQDRDMPSTGSFFLCNRNLKFADHFEINPDFLIYDPELCTYGLLWILGKDGGEELDQDLKKYLGQAVYVRHLLANEPACSSQLSPPVHVVVVLPQNDLSEIDDSLRKLMRGSEFFHAIDLHLLPWQIESDSLSPEAMKKAFCWLLHFTKRWYGEVRQKGLTKAFHEIEIMNYRAVCHRSLELSLDYNIHVLHGPNGSGKTSLAECFELVLTGKLERLGDNKGGYLAHLQGKQKDPPTIKIQGVGKKETTHTITEDGITEILWDKRVAASFLLNQEAMYKLSMSGASKRARIFLDAFFPDDRKHLVTAEDENNIEKAFKVLPKEQGNLYAGKGEELPDFHLFMQDFSWLGKGKEKEKEKEKVLINEVSQCLPLTREVLDQLAKLENTLSGPLQELDSKEIERENLKRVCADMAGALNGLRVKLIDNNYDRKISLLEEIERANILLNDYNIQLIVFDTDQDFRPYAQRVNEWLNLKILSEWGEQRLRMARSVAQAIDEGGWSLEGVNIEDFFSLGQITTDLSDKTVKDWQERCDQSRISLLDQGGSSSAEQTGRKSRKANKVRPPTQNEIDALNQVEKWLFPQRVPSLGGCIQKALLERKVSSLEGIGTVGEKKGWADTLIKQVSELSKACKDLKDLKPEQTNHFQNLVNMYDASKVLQNKEKYFKEHFLNLLVEEHGAEGGEGGVTLDQALNELLSLFTPARWAYDPLQLKLVKKSSDDANRGPVVELTSTNPQTKATHNAEYRLNTAELNQYAVALFLLLAPRMDNPLRLMVLDDPIQNMDEWSTVSLARGIGNISRILPSGWNMLLMFHGEDDMHRFTNEVPSGQYRLPWLRPTQDGPEDNEAKITFHSQNVEETPSVPPKKLWEIIN
ncbi:MAG: AAA family ATPase [Magnetococcales bacterium]|nr:AAA family ATPase [Magnetococcales bacterium]MBF0114727.1 AAA family ATPase [Magnetococcales bacterium]